MADGKAPAPGGVIVDVDDFGLPIRRYPTPTPGSDAAADEASADKSGEAESSKTEKGQGDIGKTEEAKLPPEERQDPSRPQDQTSDSDSGTADFKDAQSDVSPDSTAPSPKMSEAKPDTAVAETKDSVSTVEAPSNDDAGKEAPKPAAAGPEKEEAAPEPSGAAGAAEEAPAKQSGEAKRMSTSSQHKAAHSRGHSLASQPNATVLSEFSHQQLPVQEEDEGAGEDEWQEMPSYARYDMYDDDNRLIAREHNEDDDDEAFTYGGLGGAGKGYTRVVMDEDAQSATSMDENTQYLFKEAQGTSMTDDDDARDAMSQMQATKDLLTEGQRIAYVGMVRLEIAKLVKEAEDLEPTKKTKKEIATASEAVKMWGQKMMIRVYSHMEITEAEQVMIEQLAEHGVVPQDLTPALHANARVHNPMAKSQGQGPGQTSPPPYEGDGAADEKTSGQGEKGKAPEGDGDETKEHKANEEKTREDGTKDDTSKEDPRDDETKGEDVAERFKIEDEKPAEMPPPYEDHDVEEMDEVKTPSQLPTTDKIDIDLRWTVLCDLFLLLIADSIYDARSRVLLERVGEDLDIPWMDICRFEKRVTDALEMQQEAEKENWNEEEHMEYRRKVAQKKRYMMMGLATVGGGLVIGLSAGLLAPVIGAGLAAGFTTIGVTGTSGFLAGTGGAAIITSSAAASGSLIGGRAAGRRTGAVRTFEYRPLHNKKRVNLIVTVPGWLTGKLDDIRLPFSTVDPIMGDLYSVLWEPEMLRSMGDTINILATEALVSGLQQILGNTILVGLVAALQLPLVLTKLSYLIDNPWAVSLDRAVSAGLILADSLIERNLGTRPITLVGYSLGSRVIFSCLQELAKKGAYGLVQNVYLFGSPIVVKKEEYLRARTVVSGRFVNGYHTNDWILGYLFRLTNGGIRRVAGLAPIEDCPWIENIDVTDVVRGHMEYRTTMPSLLKRCGWLVESEEFMEIEDPDPDNHTGRQRELINEIEEARKELEREGKASKGSRFNIFGRKKKGERQEWEVYEDAAKGGGGSKVEDKEGNNHGVLFDVDAIRAEVAKETGNSDEPIELQVKEIESTLPPMKLDMGAAAERAPLRETRSADVPPLPHRSSMDTQDGQPGSRTGNATPAGGSRAFGGSVPALPEEDEIQMTFDTSFDDSPAATGAWREAGAAGATPPTRPPAKTAATLPNLKMTDPWDDGDPDDEDFGKEKEISMTFA